MVSQATPAPGFIQRNQSGFGYGSSIGPHSTTLQPQPTQSSQQQPNGTTPSSSLPSHLPPSSNTVGTGAPSVSSASEVGLDPNDFPALGSTPVTSNSNNASGGSNGSAQVATSYASQAGNAIPLGGSGAVSGTGSGATTAGGAANSSSQTRDFTPDDFPALGNHQQTQPQTQDHSHPPGLNGFQTSSEHRQNLLGSLGATHTPGMLHLGGKQTRNVHLGFGQGLSEAEKAQQRVSPGFCSHLIFLP